MTSEMVTWSEPQTIDEVLAQNEMLFDGRLIIDDTHPHINDINKPPQVGSFYRVPCLLFSWRPSGQLSKLPILSTHVGDISNVFHHHIDIRFVESRCINTYDPWPIIIVAKKGTSDGDIYELQGFKIFTNGKIYEMVFKCLFTQHPSNKLDISLLANSDSFKKLEKKIKNEDVKLTQSRICPHQGTNLKQEVPVHIKRNGVKRTCIRCPAHFIHWDAASGKIVRLTNCKSLEKVDE